MNLEITLRVNGAEHPLVIDTRTTLLDALREKSIHVVIGGIALPNAACVALHERLGFAKVAQFKEVGYKFGQWIDVGYWQKTP